LPRLANSEEKFLEELEVFEVVNWLLKQKNFSLCEEIDKNRCEELLKKFEKLKETRQSLD